MVLMDKLGKSFVITTELGPVKGTLVEQSLEKAKAYLPLDGINIHDCPNTVISRMEKENVSGIDIVCEIIEEIHDHIDGIHIMALGDVAGTNRIIEFSRSLQN